MQNRALQIASLNLKAYPSRSRTHAGRMAQLLAEHEPHVALLQECKASWAGTLEAETGLTVVHSHRVPPEVSSQAFPPDGCAIAVHPSIGVEAAWRIEPRRFDESAVSALIAEVPPEGMQPLPKRLRDRFSARALLARLSMDGRAFTAGSFHATPGTGKVGGRKVDDWKPFFHGGVAGALAELSGPYVFAIDANEPLREDVDRAVFHWPDGRSGVKKLEALLGRSPLHEARDLLLEDMERRGLSPAHAEYLALTYETRAGDGGGRRFDSMWATKSFVLKSIETYYDDVIEAGGDHALLVAQFEL